MFRRLVLLAVAAGATQAAHAQIASTSFTYQGELSSSITPMNGNFDFRFRLFGSLNGAGSAIGSELCVNNVSVENGRFTVLIDFGNQFASGEPRFLEIDVREDGSGTPCANPIGFVTLAPRQPITTAPTATFANAAASATQAQDAALLGGQAPSFYRDAANLTGTLGSNRLTGVYSQPIQLSNTGNQFVGTFSGAGTGLTSLNASNLTAGTLPSNRLSGPYNSALAFTNPSNQFTGSFSGSGASLTALNASSLTTGTIPSGAFSGSYSNALTLSNPLNVLAGNGTAITSLNASNLTSGTLPSARLIGVYSNSITLSNPGNSFTGAGTGLTSLNASNITLGTLSSSLLPTIWTLTGSSPSAIITATNANGTGLSSALKAVSSGAELNMFETYGVHGETNTWSGAGVYGVATDTIREVYGVKGVSFSDLSVGVIGISPRWGVRGIATNNLGIGIDGVSSAIESEGVGVRGTANGPRSIGVEGIATSSTTTPNEGGIGGSFSSNSQFGTGIRAVNNATTGQAHAAEFTTNGDGGTAVLVESTSGTNSIGITARSYGGAFATIIGEKRGGVGAGVLGVTFQSSGSGVIGNASSTTGLTSGGLFISESSSGTGVVGDAQATTGSAIGVKGLSRSTAGIGVLGENTVFSGDAVGVLGRTASSAGFGVMGDFTGTSSDGAGVYGRIVGGGDGVRGENLSSSSSGSGVHGISPSTGGRGLLGEATSTTGVNYGVRAVTESSSGRGIYALANATSGATYGVRGQTLSTTAGAYGVYAVGDLGASGLKTFRIDHPIDPANTYLIHYSSEGPEATNAYRGTVTLDSSGEALITLPTYFAAINTDPSYTLTAIGAPMPALHILEEIDSELLSQGAQSQPGQLIPTCTFRIGGGMPNGRVSWRVEARRNDAWARSRAMPVELPKPESERGNLQHPDLYKSIQATTDDIETPGHVSVAR